MTVISAFTVAGVPIVFGDLLTTGPTQNYAANVSVPTLGNINDFFGDSGWSVIALQQKVTLLSPSCVIAWAGNFVAARVVIGELKAIAERETITAALVLEYLNAAPELKQFEVDFIGFVLEQDKVIQFHFGAEEFDSEALGTVYLSGSGKSMVYDFADVLNLEPRDISSGADPVFEAVTTGLMLSGLLLQGEFRGGDTAVTIQEAFGGGYELAVLANGCFTKVAVTYIFWEASYEGGKIGLTNPQLIVKQKYQGDHLLIKAMHVDRTLSARAGSQPTLQHYIIDPMFASTNRPTNEDLLAVEMHSDLFCHSIIIRNVVDGFAVLTHFEYAMRVEDASIEFIELSGQTEMRIRQSLIETLLQKLGQCAASADSEISQIIGLGK